MKWYESATAGKLNPDRGRQYSQLKRDACHLTIGEIIPNSDPKRNLASISQISDGDAMRKIQAGESWKSLQSYDIASRHPPGRP
jgi:hypothetical protein